MDALIVVLLLCFTVSITAVIDRRVLFEINEPLVRDIMRVTVGLIIWTILVLTWGIVRIV